jgi:transposase InsO family protein
LAVIAPHKGVGRVYQQTFIDTYAKVACAKLYDRKTPITAADLLNDRVLPFFDEHDVKLLRVLTDRGSEYCRNPERHEYELYLAVEDIDHSRTKTKSPQTNGICERFYKTVLNEFPAITSSLAINTSCRTAAITSAEVLLRWPRRRRGKRISL